MKRNLIIISILGLLAVTSMGCSPGYDLVRQPPPHLRGRTQVVIDKVAFAAPVMTYMQNALAKRRQTDPASLDAWLQVPANHLNNAISNWLRRSGFAAVPTGSVPQGPYVRAQIEVLDMYHGSRGGAALTFLFGSYARGSHPRMLARVFLYDGASPQPVGEARVSLEYNGGFEGFPTLCLWVGERLGFFIRDALVVQR